MTPNEVELREGLDSAPDEQLEIILAAVRDSTSAQRSVVALARSVRANDQEAADAIEIALATGLLAGLRIGRARLYAVVGAVGEMAIVKGEKDANRGGNA